VTKTVESPAILTCPQQYLQKSSLSILYNLTVLLRFGATEQPAHGWGTWIRYGN